MCVGSPTAGTWSSSQWRPDYEFETDRRRSAWLSRCTKSIRWGSRRILTDAATISKKCAYLQSTAQHADFDGATLTVTTIPAINALATWARILETVRAAGLATDRELPADTTSVPRGRLRWPAPPGRTIRTSEVDPAADLEQSRVEHLGRPQPRRAAGGGVERTIQRNDRRVVGEVEDIQVPLRAHPLGQLERLGDPQVELVAPIFEL